MKISAEILSLVPYKPGKPISETQREYGLKEVIKLASNENPLGPSPKALEAMKNALQQQHLYPDPGFYEVLQKLQEKWQVPAPKMSLGNGSNEVIDLLIRLFCEPGESILTTEGSFVAYPVCAQAARVNRHFVPMKTGFQIDLEAMGEYLVKNAESQKIRLVFIPNPNNPTGSYVSESSVKTFLEKTKSLKDVFVVFDEAYNEYVRAKDYAPALKFMKDYSQVMIVRTLSKAYGLAGLRLGVLIAPQEVVALYNRIRNPFNVNDLAQVAAVAALDDDDFIKKSQNITWDGLDYFYDQLKKMGLDFVPSQGNFVLFDTRRDVVQVNEALLRRGVILRPVLNYGLKTHLRMSCGWPHENEKAIAVLKEVLAQIPELK